MDPTDSELLSTGDAAALLGCTKQHVRNLCDRGELPSLFVGTHRRIRRTDLDQHLASRDGALLRDQVRSLWLHQAVAGKLVHNPTRVLDLARRNLARLRGQHRGAIDSQFVHWDQLLNGPIETLLTTLTSTAPRAVELRQNSPFAGVLTTTERQQILNAFRATYKRAS